LLQHRTKFLRVFQKEASSTSHHINVDRHRRRHHTVASIVLSSVAMKCLAVFTCVVLGSLQQSVESFAFSARSAAPNSFRPSASRTLLNSVASDMETLLVTPIKSLDGTVTLPGSKSLSNRCLLLAALSEGTTRVDNLLESDDIRYMLEALDKLGVPVERVDETSVIVTGQGGPINAPSEEICELFLGNAGTAMRPLAAALCMGKGDFVLDGVPRMRERPIADLVDGLQQLGADVTCVEETGCPPVTIKANGLSGGKVCCLML
jgi:3-phosphoshikimate 1-carboxyvinyltransferase